MSRTALTAPAHVVLQRSPIGAAFGGNSPDAAASLNFGGGGFLDPRMAFNKFNAQSGGAAAACVGWPFDGIMAVIDSLVPSAPASGTGSIAAPANVVSGTPMTLTAVTALTNGVLATTVAKVTMPFLNTIPVGAVAIQNALNYNIVGIRDLTAFYDATSFLGRAIAVTGVASGTGGTFVVKGFDVYGQAMTENIVATAGATTVNGKKAWKYVVSATPQFTDAHNYSFDVTNIIGFPMAVLRTAPADFPYVDLYINNVIQPLSSFAGSTYVAADQTSPATATTGDVRGTFVMTAAPANNRFVLFMTPTGAQLGVAAPTLVTNVFGVTNFS